MFVARSRDWSSGLYATFYLNLWNWRKLSLIPRVKKIRAPGETEQVSGVDRHWASHTIAPFPFVSKRGSIKYIETLDYLYPLYFEKAGLYESKVGKTVLDYGCGPGNDLLGWLLFSNAEAVIGIDVSEKALEIARRRLAIHADEFDPSRITLQRVLDSNPRIPLEDESVDYVSCLGVLHHVSNPVEILQEFLRILRPGGEVRLMLYNYDSLYVHLSVAYELQVLQSFSSETTAAEAYEKISDAGAPFSRLTRASDFLLEAETLGYEASYLGAAFSVTELEAWSRLGPAAMKDKRLGLEHRNFLSNLAPDKRGFPIGARGEAGLDSIYRLAKPVSQK